MQIQGTRIMMTRGDTESLTVHLDKDRFYEGDSVTITVRQSFSEPVALQKTVTVFVDGAAVFGFEPSDTSGMSFGRYVYDIQLTRADGTVKTIITPSRGNFVLEEEVTY